MTNKNPSAFRRGFSVLGKLFVGTRKGPSGESVRHLRKVQKRLGVRFTDLSLLEQALTHRSYSHVTSQTRNDSNERMEFLGDSVLGLAVSQFLYLQFPDRSEGALSKMKSLLVSRKVLSSIARDIGLGEHLLLSGEESEMGGRDRASILADSFEGVIGSIYLDQGYRAANQFIQRSLLSRIHEILKDDEHTNYKSLLQEYVQSKRLSHPVYRVRKEEGPEHEKEFAVDVVVKGDVWGTGRGKSKKDAEQNAARAALEKRQGRSAKPRRSAGGEEGEASGSRRRRRSESPRSGRDSRRKSRSSSEAAERPSPAPAPASPPPAPEAEEAAPRARVRRRGRADVVEIETSAKDRGDHGIAASREKLRERREAEAAERRTREKERRSRRREATSGVEPDEARDVAAGGGPEGAEERDRPRRRRRRRRGGAAASAGEGPREETRGRAETPAESGAESAPARSAAPPAESAEAVEERARELRQRWDTAGPADSPEGRSAAPRAKPERKPESERKSEPVPEARSEAGAESKSEPKPEPTAGGESTGFVRRRRTRRESRPQLDTERSEKSAPAGRASADSPPAKDADADRAPRSEAPAKDASADRAPRSESPASGASQAAAREEAPAAASSPEPAGGEPTGGESGGSSAPAPAESRGASEFTRRKKRHVRGLRRR